MCSCIYMTTLLSPRLLLSHLHPRTDTPTLHNPRQRSPPPLRPTKPLHIPSPRHHSPRQHRRHLRRDEIARRQRTPRRDVEAYPLDPLAEVVRAQHPLEEAVVGEEVGFCPAVA